MRMIFGVLSLLITVAVVGLLARKQLAVLPGAGSAPTDAAGVVIPMATPQQSSQRVQGQVKKSIEDALQQTRPQADDK